MDSWYLMCLRGNGRISRCQVGSITCLSAGRPVPWEVTHMICTGAWQNHRNGLWKKGPGSAQGLSICLG